MRTISEQDYHKKMVENIKAISRWLADNVDTTEEFKYQTLGINIWSKCDGFVRIIVSDGLGLVNGRFTKDPFKWNGPIEMFNLFDEIGESSWLDHYAMNLVANWDCVAEAVKRHNEKIRKAVNFKIN